MKSCVLNLISYCEDSGQKKKKEKEKNIYLYCAIYNLVDLSTSGTLILLLVAIFENKFIKNIKAPAEVSKFFMKKLGVY